MSQHSMDLFLFVAFPYVCLIIFFVMTVYRYRTQPFTYSSLSSQFLENKNHFWSVVPFHYGILVITLGHLVAFLIPKTLLAWNSVPLRLYILEVSALAFGLLTVIGLIGIVVRRLGDPKVKVVTTPTDWILFALLLLQTITGVSIALFYPWGSSWFATAMAPYLQSIFLFRPDMSYVTAMPWLVKLHVVTAFAIFGFFPFTRLVHILVVPNHYLWRKPQVVRWYSRPSK